MPMKTGICQQSLNGFARLHFGIDCLSFWLFTVCRSLNVPFCVEVLGRFCMGQPRQQKHAAPPGAKACCCPAPAHMQGNDTISLGQEPLDPRQVAVLDPLISYPS
jgi:hypothetical protein